MCLCDEQFCADARPEAPQECEFFAGSSPEGPWRPLAVFKGPWNQEGWRDPIPFNSFAAQHWKLIVHSTHSTRREQGAAVNQVAFFGYPVRLDPARERQSRISDFNEQVATEGAGAYRPIREGENPAPASEFPLPYLSPHKYHDEHMA